MTTGQENDRILVQINFALGNVTIRGNDKEIGRSDLISSLAEERRDACALAEEVEQRLRRYFQGQKVDFGNLPMRLDGTPFQKQVWHQLRGIPYGQTRSYAQIAQAIGHPQASRAVGQANGRNPIGILIPCHRVIACDGGLGGYSGGLAIKRWLLELESHGSAGGAI